MRLEDTTRLRSPHSERQATWKKMWRTSSSSASSYARMILEASSNSWGLGGLERSVPLWWYTNYQHLFGWSEKCSRYFLCRVNSYILPVLLQHGGDWQLENQAEDHVAKHQFACRRCQHGRSLPPLSEHRHERVARLRGIIDHQTCPIQQCCSVNLTGRMMALVHIYCWIRNCGVVEMIEVFRIWNLYYINIHAWNNFLL